MGLRINILETNLTTDKTLSALAVVGVMIIFLTAFNSFYWLDDFWKNNEINQSGFWKTINWFYWNWDGRAISPIYWGRNFLLWIIPYNYSFLNSILALLTLFYSSILIFKIISNHKENLFSKFSLKYTSILFCFLWISFSAHMSRSIYWSTGSFYVYSSFGLILFIYLLEFKNELNVYHLILIFFFGLTGINVSILMILFCLYSFYFSKFGLSNKLYLIVLVILFLSFFLVFVAPGNFKRGDGGFEFEIYKVLHNYLNIWIEFILMFKWGIITSFLFALIYSKKYNSSLINSFVFLALGGIYILPFSFMDYGAPKHTAITFHILLWMSLFFIFNYFICKFQFLIKYNSKFITIVFFIYFNIHFIDQFFLGRDIKTLVEMRYSILGKFTGTDKIIYLDPILIQERNHTNRFWDMTDDPNDSFNRYLREYFVINKIVINH